MDRYRGGKVVCPAGRLEANDGAGSLCSLGSPTPRPKRHVFAETDGAPKRAILFPSAMNRLVARQVDGLASGRIGSRPMVPTRSVARSHCQLLDRETPP